MNVKKELEEIRSELKELRNLAAWQTDANYEFPVLLKQKMNLFYDWLYSLEQKIKVLCDYQRRKTLTTKEKSTTKFYDSETVDEHLHYLDLLLKLGSLFQPEVRRALEYAIYQIKNKEAKDVNYRRKVNNKGKI